MLPKLYRLTKKDGLEDVCKNGKVIRKGCLLIKYRINNLSFPRISFIVSKKIASKANKRNLIKRRLRNAAKINLSSMAEGKDIVVIALSGIDKYSFADLKEKLGSIFIK